MESIEQSEKADRFRFFAANPPGWLDPRPAIAASRCGAVGVLNCEGIPDSSAIRQAWARLRRAGRGAIGLQWDCSSPLASTLLPELAKEADFVILPGADEPALPSLLSSLSGPARILVEVVSPEEAGAAVAAGAHGLIAKGHEAGGRVGEETSFVLLQRLLSAFPGFPVFARGGIGLHSAAACYVAGAAGAVLDNQLLLTSESSLPSRVRTFLERMEGDETVCLGLEMGSFFRLAKRPGMAAAEELQQLEQSFVQSEAPREHLAEWKAAFRSRLDWKHPESGVWPLGQDASLAAPLARRFRTVSGVIRALRESIREHVRQAQAYPQLAPGSPLASAHRTEYPILQGPMTRVSDTAEFAAAVAAGGALPFLALALLRAPQVRKLLSETGQLVGSRSWGVGILGFVSAELRAEQLEVVREFRPPFAIIAGGRPDQAAALERDGIRTYLHVPAPSLLRMFVQDGARRFIFEGRECGGHVGPRTSFVLWDASIEVLLDEIRKGVPASELSIVFAGGIHDARSAAMATAMAAPLAALGVHIGVLMGTAYLFTDEAVASGAIVEEFRQEALRCRKTVLLESGPGHATRCVETPFFETFRRHKRQLIAGQKSVGEIRDALEDLNIGRLRVASKGIVRSDEGGETRYIEVSTDTQRQDGMYMIGQVAALRDQSCTIRQLHQTVSAGGAEYLQNIPVPFEDERPPAPPPPCDIAIVGLSCLLPQAPDVRAFWTNVVNGVDAIREIPAERFNIDLYFDRDRHARDKIYSRWGGFLEDTPFDPVRYGIPPNALSSIDPMQLLALLVVDRALADAGYRDREFPRDRTSVIFGMSGGLGDQGIHYAVRSSLAQYLEHPPEELLERLPEWTEDSFAGILQNVTVGRVANRFDFGGVNFTVDAACASSLAAVYIASRELNARTSEMVVVGGVDTVQSPFGYLCFSKSQALSPTGACRPFDATADGIAISEGITVLVLKRLEDAERDGDRIYSVIKGIAGSSDGRGRSMTAPRVEGQMSALRRAYAQAGFRAGTVGLIEAHGTGTSAGDAAELAALSSVFRDGGAAPQSCSIGSVKSMVGHTKSAAGVTGLMKAVLALYHQTLPPTLHVKQPNAKLCEPETPFFVNTEAQPWIPRVENDEPLPRRAGVSSFGFGGTNFHAALEEYRDGVVDRLNLKRWPAELFVWRTSSAEALSRTLAEFSTPPDPATPLSMRAASVAARAAISGGDLRLAFVASAAEELRSKIESARAALSAGSETMDASKGIYLSRTASAPKIAFLFPGQGSQRLGMMRELALHFSDLPEALSAANTVLASSFPARLSSYIYPPPAFDPAEEKKQMAALTDTTVAQPALGAVEAGACRLLRRLGVAPSMTAGHSYGEYAALYAADVIDETALFRLSEARGRVIKESVGKDSGAMAAVSADAAAVRSALNGLPEVVLANLNAPRQTVISGPTEAVNSALKALEAARLAAKLIPVACAFHSPLMRPARDRLASVLAGEDFSAPGAEVFSNSTAQPYPQNVEGIRALLADHLVEPVCFVEEIEAMYEHGARIFIEVGPRGVLTGLTQQILLGKPATLLRIDGDKNALAHFLDVLAQLWTGGVDIEIDQLFAGRMEEASASESPASWMVNGGGVFHSGHKPAPFQPLKLQAPPAIPTSAPAAIPSPVVTATNTETADTVMLEFERLMSQFLETQSAVMTSYLGGASASAPVPVTAPAAAIPKPEKLSPPPVAASAPTPAPSLSAQRNYAAELRQIAAERTGYPEDMLDLDAGMEADLGIDSIKRTEILNGFQRRCTAEEQTRVQTIMETLTSARTLREIANKLGAALPTAAQPAPVTTAHRDYAAELRQIAAERTGYPEDMLDLDAGMEADLGIDSIKRTEILNGFQRRCTAEEQARVQAIMETLTSARTLREIANKIGAALLTVAKPAPAPTAQRDYAAELRQIAAERTGYPEDMLDLDAGMEADLGIDSIKRTEILNGFQRRCTPEEQARMQAILETLARARTLREIANKIGSALAPSAPMTAVPRCILETKSIPRYASVPQYHKGRISLITDDECGIAAGFAEELAKAGERPLLLRHSPDASLHANGVWSADLTSAEAVAELVATVQQEYGPIGAVIHLLPLRMQAAPSNLADWHNALSLDIKCLYALARATEGNLKQTGRNGGALLAAITARGGEFGLRPSETAPLTHHAIADFVKTVAFEFPEVLCRIVDLDASDPVPILLQKLIDELCSSATDLQVGLPGDHRLTVVPRLFALSGEPLQRIGRDWVCLLTGGARGITAEIAKQLARRAQPVLILAGASPLPSGEEPPDTAGIEDASALKAALMRRLRAGGNAVKPAEVEAAFQRLLKNRQILETLRVLRDLGARVEYHSVDVRDETAFGSLLDDIYERYGRLDVVVHGAGIIEDKLLRDKTPSSFDNVVLTKADSAFTLQRKLRPHSLRCLLFMSSISAMFGNRGQADYAAANGIYNGLSIHLAARWPARVVAMNWGPWDQAGMVSDETREQFLARGVQIIPPNAGAEAALQEIECGAHDQVLAGLGGGPWLEGAEPAGASTIGAVLGSGG